MRRGLGERGWRGMSEGGIVVWDNGEGRMFSLHLFRQFIYSLQWAVKSCLT